MDVLNDLSINTRLDVFNDLSVNNKFDIFSDLSVNNKFDVFSDLSVNNKFDIFSDLSVNSKFDVLNDLSVNNKFDVFSDLSVNNHLDISGDLSINTNLQIGNDLSINYNLYNNSGNIQATLFSAVSDKNKKTDIQPITDALSIINDISGVSFRWKHMEHIHNQYGFIAQDIEAVLSDLVTTTSDGKLVNYNGVLPYLVETIKLLDKELTMLEALYE